MLKRFQIVFASILAFSTAMAIEVSNVHFAQRTDGSRLVDIGYELDQAGIVRIELSLDGIGFAPIPEALLSGAVGSVPAGAHNVVFDLGGFGQVDTDAAVIKVIAEDQLEDMALVPAGSFNMGQTGVATPVHLVTLTNDFLLGMYEVTNAQYVEAANWALEHGYATLSGNSLYSHGQSLLNMNSPQSEIAISNGVLVLRRAPGAGDWGFPEWNTYDPAPRPVNEVNWYGAACYCDWLSLMSGRPAYYNGLWSQIPSVRNPYSAEGFRLPTEAEWEYAAQFGDERTYPWGDTAPTCEHASYRPSNLCVLWSSPVGTHPVGASSLGLQDMSGNIWEWCNDNSDYYSSTPQTNPVGPSYSAGRIRRGGNWGYDESHMKCASRDGSGPSHTNMGIGFRICRTL